MGIDWGNVHTKSEKLDRPTVLAYTPNMDTPVWQRVPNIVLPASRLMSRNWYEIQETSDKTALLDLASGSVAGYLSTSVANKVYGEVWINYTIVMTGTRSV